MGSSEFDAINLIAAFFTISLGITAIYQKINSKKDLTKYIFLSFLLLIFVCSILLGRVLGALHNNGYGWSDVWILAILYAVCGLFCAFMYDAFEGSGFLARRGQANVVLLMALIIAAFFISYMMEFLAVPEGVRYRGDFGVEVAFSAFGSLFATAGAACFFYWILEVGAQPEEGTSDTGAEN